METIKEIMKETIEGTIKKMVGIQTGAEVAAVVEVMAIVALDMAEVGVEEGEEVMVAVAEGWVVTLWMVATKPSLDCGVLILLYS